ncbi:MAG: dTDP-4-dehydrorhamnose reductase [Bacteroidota bacterium]|nr:dTDP-4-dehydrorhamnose reductase [Bacteroidota bacterium]
MRILVTGCNGQLGNEIKVLSNQYKSFNFIFSDINELDITNRKSLYTFIENNSIDFIINCAAYTNVNKAENEVEFAYLINETAVGYLAQISSEKNIRLIQVSTDYVFDGNHYLPYKEDDITNPLSIYGKTKLAGEKKILSSTNKAIIIRTSWLYSSFGNNFVKTIIRLGNENNLVKMVYDQIGTPTYAADLADTILKIISSGKDFNETEIFHYSNEGVISWYDFAQAIIEDKNISCKILPIETWEYPTPAKRPCYSVFNKAKIKKEFDIEIPYWRESLRKMLKRL